MLLLPADVILTRSDTWLGRAIRAAERRGSDTASYNHVGVVVSAGELPPQDGDWRLAPFGPVMVEALGHVLRRPVWEGYGPQVKDQNAIAVYRPLNLEPGQGQSIARSAMAYVGERYGWWKLFFHLGDAVISKVAGRDVRLLRRALFVKSRPICSFLVAKAFAAVGLGFGVKPGSADPDDVADFCRQNPDKYELIFEGRLS